MKALVVDDDLALADVVSFTLRRAGFEVVLAHDGRSALERFRDAVPQIVILDLELPEMDGVEVCRAIRGQSDTPIIMLTVRDRDEDIDIKYTSVFRELLTYMMEDPRNITACTHLLFCAKNLERIGDHVTNIAENAYYVVTGALLPLARPKRDETTPAA